MGFPADSPKHSSAVARARPGEWLRGGGEMGKLVRSMDWAKTSLGSIGSWPQSLRTAVSLCLASNFPISLAWGPKHIQIYNDGYWPICGGKHPESMGQDFSECWAAPWPIIGEAFERALAGETSFLENQRMFLDRHGFLEETCFTFSFSPILDESGGVGGLFHPVTETTVSMLSERRAGFLRDLAARCSKAKSTEEAFALAAQTVPQCKVDMPFVLFYSVDPVAKQARLEAASGLASGTPASPAIVNLAAIEPLGWPLAEAFRSGQSQLCDDVQQRFGTLPAGPYPESVKDALVLPIRPPGCDHPVALLVAAFSPRLPMRTTYRPFLELMAAGVTTAIANGRAHTEERKRAEALAEIDRTKTAFFSNVSHEFRTPLTLMLGPLEEELAEHDAPLPPQRRERLEAAHRNSLRLLKLVNTLLDFSRIEAGRMRASYEPVDLAAHTAELTSVFRSATEKAGLTLTIDCPKLPEPVYVDREMWEKVVLNLMSNALKHTFQGGITVKLAWCGDHTRLEVTDTGVGIPASEQPRLFERFHRIKGAKSRSHEGTGIGLALLQELVLMHGGTVQVQSTENDGSTFIVTVKNGSAHLPADLVAATTAEEGGVGRADVYVEEALRWIPEAQPEGGAKPDLHSLPGDENLAGVKARIEKSAENKAGKISKPAAQRFKILWADDNADMRAYVSRLLAEKYEVTAVADGLAALAHARVWRPDLVLSDVMMPGLDGFGLLRELRSREDTRDVPVILLSARAREESAVEGLDAGADDYLAKPFVTRELLARVRTHLELARVRKAWAKELEEANQELEAFSYSISHDLRAPLRRIDGFSQALQDKYGEKLDETGRGYLSRVLAGSQKMGLLLDDLLKLSRVTRGPMRKDAISLTDIARQVIGELREREPDRRVSVGIADGMAASGDLRLMTVVLVNLLGNAWKYSSKKREAEIVMGQEKTARETIFCVRDNGAGFDMTYAAKLFAPFHRLHAESEFEGSGIGLATVKRIISHHGGRIWATAQPDAGASFFFTLENPR